MLNQKIRRVICRLSSDHLCICSENSEQDEEEESFTCHTSKDRVTMRGFKEGFMPAPASCKYKKMINK